MPQIILMAVLAFHIVRLMGQVGGVPGVAGGFGIDQQHIVNPPETAGVGTAGGAFPDDFVAVIFPPEQAIHYRLEVVAGGVVAVQIDGAGVFEQAAHFQQADRHHNQIAFHPLAVGQAGGVNDGVEGRFRVGDFAVPGQVDVAEVPGVLKGGAGGRAANRGGVVPVGIKGRVKVNQVGGVGVHSPHNFQVVAGPEGLVFPVGGHKRRPCLS